jgi:hypothetical protein
LARKPGNINFAPIKYYTKSGICPKWHFRRPLSVDCNQYNSYFAGASLYNGSVIVGHAALQNVSAAQKSVFASAENAV